MEKTSNISGFYKLKITQRRELVKNFAGLTDKDLETLGDVDDPLTSVADKMIENVIGTTRIPLGIAVNFLINGRDYLIPMAIEEPSVVAAASNAAKLARIRGGFYTNSTDPVMIGQIQILGVRDPYAKRVELLNNKAELLRIANEQDPVLNRFGGGAKDVVVRVLDSARGPMLIIHLLVDTRDAMGANAVNTMCEALTDKVSQITGGRVGLRIISNLAVYRLSRAKATFDKEALGGEDVVDKIIDAYAFAEADVFRCATHNKGIMNGITALMLATCNDTRAVEAGAHAYAALNGGYKPLTRWEKDVEGNLVGSIELPMAVGLVGGATKVHPIAQLAIKILNVKTANELGEVAAALGLAQNFAAIRALATEGIQRGHMRLHARNIAITAGAGEDIIDRVVEELIKIGKIRVDVAEKIIKELQKTK
ncbi:MAG: hydroxymethylglutaryl-CoA reductase, degradative [Candidatus Odinarchaeota archaeon]